MSPRTPLALIVGLLGIPRAAHADPRLHLEGFGALPVGGWQAQGFGPGGGLTVGVEASLMPRLGLLASGGYTVLSQADGTLPSGVARPGAGGFGHVAVGARLRLAGYVGVRGEGLWLDLQGGGAVTGSAVRPMVLARLGYGFSSGRMSVGPWVGGAVVFQTDSQNLRDDARLIEAGVEFSLLGGRQAPRPVIRPVPPVHRCPAPAAHTLPDADGDGCPEDDTDGDRIADRVDECPLAPEDYDGFQDQDGCPDLDNDRDGIPDVRDLCPNVPEVVNGVDDDDGCPDEAAVHVDDGQVVLDEHIHFEYDSARVDPLSYGTIRAIARLMAAHPEFTRLSIEGHADDRGSDLYNDHLSYNRARAVADLLISYGLVPGRVDALGFGRRLPHEVGTDEHARTANRRVEFYVGGHRRTGTAWNGHEFVHAESDGTTTPVEAP